MTTAIPSSIAKPAEPVTRMLERLAALPPVPGALDQIVQHFGSDAVAEVTGRSRRIVPRASNDGSVALRRREPACFSQYR